MVSDSAPSTRPRARSGTTICERGPIARISSAPSSPVVSRADLTTASGAMSGVSLASPVAIVVPMPTRSDAASVPRSRQARMSASRSGSWWAIATGRRPDLPSSSSIFTKSASSGTSSRAKRSSRSSTPSAESRTSPARTSRSCRFVAYRRAVTSCTTTTAATIVPSPSRIGAELASSTRRLPSRPVNSISSPRTTSPRTRDRASGHSSRVYGRPSACQASNWASSRRVPLGATDMPISPSRRLVSSTRPVASAITTPTGSWRSTPSSCISAALRSVTSMTTAPTPPTSPSTRMGNQLASTCRTCPVPGCSAVSSRSRTGSPLSMTCW